MKKLLLTLFLSLIWIGSASSQERETEWEGFCFIQHEGKILVDNKICKLGSDDMPIDKKDEFLVVATKHISVYRLCTGLLIINNRNFISLIES